MRADARRVRAASGIGRAKLWSWCRWRLRWFCSSVLGLMIRTFVALTHVDPRLHFAGHAADIPYLRSRNARARHSSAPAWSAWNRQLQTSCGALPGVSSVAYLYSDPAGRIGSSNDPHLRAGSRFIKMARFPPIRRLQIRLAGILRNSRHAADQPAAILPGPTPTRRGTVAIISREPCAGNTGEARPTRWVRRFAWALTDDLAPDCGRRRQHPRRRRRQACAQVSLLAAAARQISRASRRVVRRSVAFAIRSERAGSAEFMKEVRTGSLVGGLPICPSLNLRRSAHSTRSRWREPRSLW